MSFFQRKPKNSKEWVDMTRNERHYCEICNAWMGSDKQSILIHESGKKHKENLRLHMEKRKESKKQEQKYKSDLEKTMAEINRVAELKSNIQKDAGLFSGVSTPGSLGVGINAVSSSALPVVPSSSSFIPLNQNQVRCQEVNSWQKKKEAKSLERRSKNDEEKDGDDNNIEPEHVFSSSSTRTTKKDLGLDKGHYQIDQNIYLKGDIYSPLFVNDMPVQIWTKGTGTGGINITIGKTKETKHSTDFDAIRQSAENQVYWKTGLICKIHEEKKNGDDSNIILVDVAYLSQEDEEIIEKRVLPDRIRILLGSGTCAEDGVPNSLEEAQLELMGGEEEIIVQNDTTLKKEVVDNNHHGDNDNDISGMVTSWTTVSIRKYTTNHKIKKERAAKRNQRKLEHEIEEKNKRLKRERQLEEAKYLNADDSALGAYDVWNVVGVGKNQKEEGDTAGEAKEGSVKGYKGVDILREAKVDYIANAVSKLSKGKKNVAFKKKVKKKPAKESSEKPKTKKEEKESEENNGGKNIEIKNVQSKKRKKFRRKTFDDE